jgi:hypothetical protein
MKQGTGAQLRSGRRTSRGAWRRFVTIALSALAVVSVLDVVLLVRADGAHVTSLAWFWLPVALFVAARRAYRLPGAEARVG